MVWKEDRLDPQRLKRLLAALPPLERHHLICISMPHPHPQPPLGGRAHCLRVFGPKRKP